MTFGTGSNAELTKKYERVKVQNYIRTSKHNIIYKLTSIPDFQLLPLRVSRSLRSLANNVHFFSQFCIYLEVNAQS